PCWTCSAWATAPKSCASWTGSRCCGLSCPSRAPQARRPSRAARPRFPRTDEPLNRQERRRGNPRRLRAPPPSSRAISIARARRLRSTTVVLVVLALLLLFLLFLVLLLDVAPTRVAALVAEQDRAVVRLDLGPDEDLLAVAVDFGRLQRHGLVRAELELLLAEERRGCELDRPLGIVARAQSHEASGLVISDDGAGVRPDAAR